jgi:O-antigen ligase
VRNSSKALRKTDITPLKWILTTLILVTLYFKTNLADPFNSPKLWLLIVASAWLSGYVISYREIILALPQIKRLSQLLFLFVFFLFISTLFTDFKYVAFLGETQRRNGFLQYFSLSIVLLVSAMYFRFSNIKKLYLATYFIALVSFSYSLLQTTGNDFVSWNNPYNSIISTLGNPNFAAAAMAIMGVITLASIFISEFKYSQKTFAAILLVSLIFIIYRSNARQGLLSFAIGAGVYVTIWLWGLNKKFGIVTLLFGVMAALFSILGMLQIGPLEKYLYKSSVSVRGYYWRAGIEMLSDRPFFGVGIDRYGSYFKEYREVNYPLSVGFELTSTNAHNTFIQFFATGGIFLGLSYLLLNAYILKCGIIGIRKLKDRNKLYLVGVFSAWIAYHAQSLVSIDNIGLSVWGWLLAGGIVGLSSTVGNPLNSEVKPLTLNNSKKSLNQTLVSSTMTIIALVFVLLLYRGENLAFKGSAVFNLQDSNSRTYMKDLQMDLINTPLMDPSYKLMAATKLIQGGFTEGLVESERVLAKDRRNLDALKLLAETYEKIGNLAKANQYRLQISKLDPWNAANLLVLAQNYKKQENLTQSQVIVEKILSFASNHPIADEARNLLGLPN